MDRSFYANLPFIENEFENAKFDTSTGIDPAVLYESLKEMSDAPTDAPRTIVHAKLFSHLLDNVQLQINEHTPFSVKLNFGIEYSDFATACILQKAISKAQSQVRKEKLPIEYTKFTEFAAVGLDWMAVDFTHTIPNWPYLLENGFAGVLKNAQKSKQTLLKDKKCKKEQIIYLDSVILCYDAIIRLLGRIYEYSLGFDVPDFSKCIQNLMVHPPKTLYEVMLLSILYLYLEETGLERARSLGPIDLLYLPYYENDKKSGNTEAELHDLFRYYFIHFTAAKRFAEQPFTICGSDKDGNDLTNELSHVILDIHDEMGIYDPKIHIRCHSAMDESILKKAVSMIRGGHSSICLINDEAVFKGYERLGIPREDSQHYVISGCYEPIIMGMEEAEICAMRFNTVKCVEFALNGGKDIMTGAQVGYESPLDIKNFDEFFDIFLKQLDYCTDFALDFIEKQGRYSTLMNPSPVYSASFPECIEKGFDVHEYPLKYNNLSLKHHGLATTVDSLFAIKKYVYDQKDISLDDMRCALSCDWQGYEDLQIKMIKDKEKYGNNMDAPDKIMTDLLKHLGDRYCGKDLERGGKVRLGLDSVYHCIKHGTTTSATPNGRNAKQPISKNLCATDGMDRGGITAYMQSFLKIDSSSFVDGVPFDFILHPSAVEGEKGLKDFISLVKIFLDCGGFAIQGNVISGDVLKEAQQNPEKYATLQVRVCGWNEYFVKLSKIKQDMFIKQCEVSG